MLLLISIFLKTVLAESVGGSLTSDCYENSKAPCLSSWLEWTAVGSCSKKCGMKGQLQRVRSCSSTDCDCEGDLVDTIACPEKLCDSGPICEEGYEKKVKGSSFTCQPTEGAG
ncbi:unnamed protein product, partial [Mesorhabditis spiculigera]